MGRKRIVNDKELLIYLDQGMTHKEIADKLGVSRPAVTHAVKRVNAALPQRGVPTDPIEFKRQELDLTISLKAKMMKILDNALPKFDWNKMSVGDLKKMVDAVAKLANEERLMRGESTQNVAVIKQTYLDMNEETRQAVKELSEAMRQEMLKEADEEYKKGIEEGDFY